MIKENILHPLDFSDVEYCIKKGEEDLVTFIDETLYFSYEKSTWWIDSGATVHVANSL